MTRISEEKKVVNLFFLRKKIIVRFVNTWDDKVGKGV